MPNFISTQNLFGDFTSGTSYRFVREVSWGRHRPTRAARAADNASTACGRGEGWAKARRANRPMPRAPQPSSGGPPPQKAPLKLQGRKRKRAGLGSSKHSLWAHWSFRCICGPRAPGADIEACFVLGPLTQRFCHISTKAPETIRICCLAPR